MSGRKRLGRGLDVLLGTTPTTRDVAQPPSERFTDLPLSVLRPGAYQPRQPIHDDSLQELADSIRQRGVLQPLLVRSVQTPAEDPVNYEIVAGERRWRAARLAGLDAVPVLIHDLDDQSALAIALIENLQREDLGPIDVAESLRRLTDEFGLTHGQAADAVGRSRSAVSNFLRLLDLEPDVILRVRAGELDMGHARALLTLSGDRQREVAARVAQRRLSVRETERLVQALVQPQQTEQGGGLDLQTQWLQKQLAAESGLRVAFRHRADGSRVLGVRFDDLEQLQEALRRIESLIGQVRETAGPRVKND